MRIKKYSLLIILLLATVWMSGNVVGQSNIQVNASLKFKNLQNDLVELKNYTGQITIINLWSTWSASCVKEMPVMERIHQDYYAQNVKVVGIAVFSDNKKIGQMLRLTKVSYPVLIASKDQVKVFGNLSIIPQTFILDANGNVLDHFVGSQSFNKLSRVIDRLIESQTLSKNLN